MLLKKHTKDHRTIDHPDFLAEGLHLHTVDTAQLKDVGRAAPGRTVVTVQGPGRRNRSGSGTFESFALYVKGKAMPSSHLVPGIDRPCVSFVQYSTDL